MKVHKGRRSTGRPLCIWRPCPGVARMAGGIILPADPLSAAGGAIPEDCPPPGETQPLEKGQTLEISGKVSPMSIRFAVGGTLLALALASGPAFGQAKKSKPAPAPAAPAPQKIDEEYPRLTKEHRREA